MSETRHTPVLLAECLHFLEPAPGKLIADLTLGGGGHSEALLRAGAAVIGFDRDPEALARSATRLLPHEDRFTPVHRGFGEIAEALEELGHSTLDGVLMDLGLSSDQLDTADRGFAHRLAGPLDLRFDPSSGRPASEWVAAADVDEIMTCLRDFGEIRGARSLAKKMVRVSREGMLTTTTQLRELVINSTHPRHREAELARVFQALRIEVNQELQQLDRALAAMPRVLHSGGRFVCISYHSLEDRRVKHALREASGRSPRGSRHLPQPPSPDPTFRELTTKVVRAAKAETSRNPRARSARLRAAERIG